MDLSQQILSDIVVFQKYARHLDALNRRESWQELCDRNMAMHIRKYPQLKDRIKQVYADFVVPRKILPSMRSMQFGGAPIEVSNNRIFNCAFSAVDHYAVFPETMFNLLSGSGCGHSVQKRHVSKLPLVVGPSGRNRRFLVSDNIEGWADAVKILVKAYFYGKSNPVFDFRDIRPKGSRLITSGGKAPGPDPLRVCLEKIRSVLNGAVGRKLKTIEVHDINCHIADAVLSGGIRRAAMIVLFDKDDMDMLYSKSGDWWELNPQRGRANNSVLLKRGEVTEEEFQQIWEIVKNSGSGEPGFVWADDLDAGTNPCLVGASIVEVMVGDKYHRISIEDLIDLISEGKQIKIKSCNEDGDVVWAEVSDGAMTKRNAELVRVTDTDSGKSVICTPDHKIFTENRGWVEAQNLLEDDKLRTI